MKEGSYKKENIAFSTVDLADKYSAEQLIDALKQQLSDFGQDSAESLLSHYTELISSYEGLLNSIKETETPDQTPRRYTVATEGDIAEKRKHSMMESTGISPLPAIHKPDFSKEIAYPIFIKTPSQEMIIRFQQHLTDAVRFSTTIKVLEHAIFIPDFIAPGVGTGIMNTFLQDGDVRIDNQGRVEMDQLITAWEGQKLTFRVNNTGIMEPINDDDPSEVAFYKLEARHNIFKRVAEELASAFRKLYDTKKDNSDIHSVSLSMRYLVPEKGGNAIHVDAWKDTTLSKGYLYTNQQFSLFLSTDEREEFVVYEKDGSKTMQKGDGSLMGFNPTQRHHHPDGHGSWILIIEVLKKQPITV